MSLRGAKVKGEGGRGGGGRKTRLGEDREELLGGERSLRRGKGEWSNRRRWARISGGKEEERERKREREKKICIVLEDDLFG